MPRAPKTEEARVIAGLRVIKHRLGIDSIAEVAEQPLDKVRTVLMNPLMHWREVRDIQFILSRTGLLDQPEWKEMVHKIKQQRCRRPPQVDLRGTAYEKVAKNTIHQRLKAAYYVFDLDTPQAIENLTVEEVYDVLVHYSVSEASRVIFGLEAVLASAKQSLKIDPEELCFRRCINVPLSFDIDWYRATGRPEWYLTCHHSVCPHVTSMLTTLRRLGSAPLVNV
jgi:hypothetical protein